MQINKKPAFEIRCMLLVAKPCVVAVYLDLQPHENAYNI